MTIIVMIIGRNEAILLCFMEYKLKLEGRKERKQKKVIFKTKTKSIRQALLVLFLQMSFLMFICIIQKTRALITDL